MIPEEARKLLTFRGFDDRVLEHYGKDPKISMKQAYRKTEDEYVGYFGKTRYSSVYSYRASKSKVMRKARKR